MKEGDNRVSVSCCSVGRIPCCCDAAAIRGSAWKYLTNNRYEGRHYSVSSTQQDVFLILTDFKKMLSIYGCTR
jgi:hypothetical protein